MSYKIIDLEQGTPGWHAYRALVIGASEVPAILGVSPWCTPLQLFERKTGIVKDTYNPGMARGHRLEAEAMRTLIEVTGRQFSPAVLQSVEYPWLSASLDGLSPCGLYIAEVKAPNARVIELAKNNELPLYYYYQVQQQLLVSGAVAAYYFAYDGAGLGHVVHVAPDHIAFELILTETKRFWDDLQAGVAPHPSEEDHIALEDKEAVAAAFDWMDAKLALDRATKQEKKAKDALTALSDDGNFRVVSNNETLIRATRVLRKGSTEWARVWQDACEKHSALTQEIDLADYTKPQIGYWKVSFSKNEKQKV